MSLRDAAQAALVEFEKNLIFVPPPFLAAAVAVAEDLRAALAQQEQPVAWRCKDYADDWIYYTTENEAAKYREETDCLTQPLYTHPALPAGPEDMKHYEAIAANYTKCVPLTDEAIHDLAHMMVKGCKSIEWLARAVERAHGIGSDK